MLAKLNEKPDKVKQGPSDSPQMVFETSDRSCQETDISRVRGRILSDEFNMDKMEVDRFFVSAARDGSNKLTHLNCTMPK